MLTNNDLQKQNLAGMAPNVEEKNLFLFYEDMFSFNAMVDPYRSYLTCDDHLVLL